VHCTTLHNFFRPLDVITFQQLVIRLIDCKHMVVCKRQQQGGKKMPWPKVPASTVSPPHGRLSHMDALRAHRTNEQPLRESDTAARPKPSRPAGRLGSISTHNRAS
jgi:hypothetical protein